MIIHSRKTVLPTSPRLIYRIIQVSRPKDSVNIAITERPVSLADTHIPFRNHIRPSNIPGEFQRSPKFRYLRVYAIISRDGKL